MEISSENIKIASDFFRGNTEAFDKMDSNYRNLFMAYATDNNSSSLRELVTLDILGYKPNYVKHGHDGVNETTGRLIEVKPKYVELGKKVGNSGNFNDMTMELLESKKDFIIVCSLFSGNRIIYIVEFPISVIFESLKKPIIEAKVGKRVVCGFNYKNYDCDELIIHYFDSQSAMQNRCLSKPHLEMLLKRYKKEHTHATLTKFFEC